MKTLTSNFIQWISSLFPSRQSKMEAELNLFVDRLNDLFLNFLDQMDLIIEKKFNIEIFQTENPEVDFGLNERKKNFKLSHWWIVMLIFFCVLADFYVMREVAGQFGISNPNFGLLVGLGILLIELTLAALAFNTPGEEDKNHIVNQLGKFTFLLFIPAMCFLNYYQNSANQMFGATEISLQIVRYKMLIIAFFSLIVHLELVLNIEKGFITISETIARNKYHKMQQDLDHDLKILGSITAHIRLIGGSYLRKISRFNILFPSSQKRVEYLPEGVISLINDGQMEDVINLKNTPLTQVKPGYSRQELTKLRLSKYELNIIDIPVSSKPQYIRPTEKNSPSKEPVPEENTDENIEAPEIDIPQSYTSFFGTNEKTI